MRALSAVILLALHTSAVAAQPAAPAEPPQAAEQDLLEAEFYAAIGAEGETYRQFRDRILQRGPAVGAFLTDKAQNGKTWQEQTMGWILLGAPPEEGRGRSPAPRQAGGAL